MGWDRSPRSLLEEIYEDDWGAALRDVSLTGLRGVILKTPVDTGRLRGGWLVSIGSGSGTVSTQTFAAPGQKKLSPAEAAATQYALNAGNLTISGANFGDVIVIENNVEYGVFVNDGSPTNRPQRMLERTVTELQTAFGL